MAAPQSSGALQVAITRQQLLPNHTRQDFIRAVGNIDDPKVLPCMDEAEFVSQAHASMGLYGAIKARNPACTE